MQEFKPVKEGKVREVYDNGDSLIIVATDRISAFDHILKNKITKKGAILTQMSKFWFDYTKDVIKNHMLSCSWIYYRKRLGKLQREWHCLWYPSSGRLSRI